MKLRWPITVLAAAARRAQTLLIKLSAYDHLYLFGWPLPLPIEAGAPS